MVITSQRRWMMMLFLPLPLILVLVFLGYMALSNIRDQVRGSVKSRVALAASVGEIRPAFGEMENRLYRILIDGPEGAAFSESLETVSHRIEMAVADLAAGDFRGPDPEISAAMERLRSAWEQYRDEISPVLEEPPADIMASMKEEALPAARKAVTAALSTVEAQTRAQEAAALRFLEDRIQRHSAMIVANGAMNLLLWIALSVLMMRAEKRRKEAQPTAEESEGA